MLLLSAASLRGVKLSPHHPSASRPCRSPEYEMRWSMTSNRNDVIKSRSYMLEIVVEVGTREDARHCRQIAPDAETSGHPQPPRTQKQLHRVTIQQRPISNAPGQISLFSTRKDSLNMRLFHTNHYLTYKQPYYPTSHNKSCKSYPNNPLDAFTASTKQQQQLQYQLQRQKRQHC
jgi:hypothetical protein